VHAAHAATSADAAHAAIKNAAGGLVIVEIWCAKAHKDGVVPDAHAANAVTSADAVHALNAVLLAAVVVTQAWANSLL